MRKPGMLRRWMESYAAATATTTAFDRIRQSAAGGEEPAHRDTAGAYREVLERLWILDPVTGWIPSRNRLTRLTQAPKHHLADPGLAARLLGVDEGALLHGAPTHTASPVKPLTPRDGSLFGRLFESLVTLSVRVLAQASEARVHHLRTKEGRQEVDLIVERDDQRVLAIEVKLGASVDDHDVRHLQWLKEQLGEELLDMVVVTTGGAAYRRGDGVAVVPAGLLGA